MSIKTESRNISFYKDQLQEIIAMSKTERSNVSAIVRLAYQEWRKQNIDRVKEALEMYPPPLKEGVQNVQ